MKKKERGIVRVFRIKIPKKTSDEFDKLIESGVYITYADAIRHAIELLLKDHEKIIEENM